MNRNDALMLLIEEAHRGEFHFPTSAKLAIKIRQTLDDPNCHLEAAGKLIQAEPLLAAQVIAIANSVAYNPAGNVVKDLKSAVTRVGINAVCSAVMSIVLTQIRRSKGMAEFSDITQNLWEHSVRTAAAAQIISKKLTTLNAEEAMLAGLVHDLGAFYMLYRATQYEDLRSRPGSLRYLIINWHESIGASLLNALGLPEEIVQASVDHDHPRPAPTPPRNYSDVIYIANMLAGGHFEWLMQEKPEPGDLMSELELHYGYLLPEIETLSKEMHQLFS